MNSRYNYGLNVASGSTSPSNSNKKAKNRKNINDFYAASQFVNSPAAHTIPMPPSNWIVQNQRPSSSQSTKSSQSTSTRSSASSSPSTKVAEMAKTGHVGGIRINPIQLIAAVGSA